MEDPEMATSPEAFHQVKEILRKLDRSIDSARDKRLSGSEPGPVAPPTAPAALNRTEPLGSASDSGPLRARPLRSTDPAAVTPLWIATPTPATGTNGHPGR